MKKDLESLINQFLEEIDSSPSGQLSLYSRKTLWNAITSNLLVEKKRVVLTTLDTICVKYGMQIWERKFIQTAQIEKILEAALDAATGALSQLKALSIRDDFYVAVVEDEDYATEEYGAMFIGHAAANTIATAVDDFKFDPNDLRNDRDFDPDAFEPSYLVSSAFAGGLSEDGNPLYRRNFWKWYLTSAIERVVSIADSD